MVAMAKAHQRQQVVGMADSEQVFSIKDIIDVQYESEKLGLTAQGGSLAMDKGEFRVQFIGCRLAEIMML